MKDSVFFCPSVKGIRASPDLHQRFIAISKNNYHLMGDHFILVSESYRTQVFGLRSVMI